MTVGPVEVTPQQFLRLVGDSQRWRLLTELAASDRRVGELCALLGKPQNLVSYHLGELRDAGLVSARRSSADGRDSYYRVEVLRCGELLCAAGAAIDPGIRLGVLPPERDLNGRGRTRRVLFLCTGNSARSQMAEALLEHRSGHPVVARSAGSHPKAVHPNAVRVMAERGIDIAGNASKHLSRFARGRFDHVITLCDKVREICPELPGRPITAHWSMADPAAEGADDHASYAGFVRTADELESRIGGLIDRLHAHPSGRRTHAR